jgi:hypothetical protein
MENVSLSRKLNNLKVHDEISPEKDEFLNLEEKLVIKFKHYRIFTNPFEDLDIIQSIFFKRFLNFSYNI